MRKFFAFLAIVALAGCESPAPGNPPAAEPTSKPPVFRFAVSEYPSWSTFLVAAERGLIAKEEGKLGAVEKDWNVDIVLISGDYDATIQQYGIGDKGANAVTITNMDVLKPSLTVPSVAVCPTSTSFGADGIVTLENENVSDLKNCKFYGLESSVSQYLFDKWKQRHNLPGSVTFQNMDPGAVAQALVSGQNDPQNKVRRAVLWNPFLGEVLKKCKSAKLLGDSTEIPGEIIDMIVVSQATMASEGGERFACAIVDCFYRMSDLIDTPGEVGDKATVALGEKFSHLDLQEMRKCLQQTKFYKTPDAGITLYSDKNFPEVMKEISDFCVLQGMTSKPAVISYSGGKDVNLAFTTQIMERVAAKRNPAK